MGHRTEACGVCGKIREVACSCRNRHCPTCGQYTKAKWLYNRKEEMLPVRHFHKVFTLPHDFNPLMLCNRKLLLDLLFKCVSETLLTFGKNPRNQFHGGELGFMLFLHTWDQRMMDHFHLHAVIPGGVLSEDQMEWIGVGKSRYLFKRGNLSQIFRGKFLSGIMKIHDQGKLYFPDSLKNLSNKNEFRKFLEWTARHDWVIHSKATIQNAEYLFEYISQYTHRVAITNDRILSDADGKVLFKYKDRQDGDKTKPLELDATEFLRRLNLHFLPKGFMKVRCFGWMANRYRKIKLSIIRESLRISGTEKEENFEEWFSRKSGINPFLCPFCKNGNMIIVSVHYGNPNPVNTS